MEIFLLFFAGSLAPFPHCLGGDSLYLAMANGTSLGEAFISPCCLCSRQRTTFVVRQNSNRKWTSRQGASRSTEKAIPYDATYAFLCSSEDGCGRWPRRVVFREPGWAQSAPLTVELSVSNEITSWISGLLDPRCQIRGYCPASLTTARNGN